MWDVSSAQVKSSKIPQVDRGKDCYSLAQSCKKYFDLKRRVFGSAER